MTRTLVAISLTGTGDAPRTRSPKGRRPQLVLRYQVHEVSQKRIVGHIEEETKKVY
jgi:hypothetical protein